MLVDCLTLWLSNLMLGAPISTPQTASCWRRWPRRPAPIVLVSNEVGLGIVPDNALARRFRDLQGPSTSGWQRGADRVVLMVAGLPLAVKGAP